jgi:hypothetical protein
VHELPSYGVEAKRWTVVFHRKSENWFFRTLAMGHFKHVSAFAWLPELQLWVIYDVGFRRTRLMHLAESPAARTIIAAIAKGNALVTMDTRHDNLPLMRLGMFCTSSVAHLVGLQCVALRPDALFRYCLKHGGTLIDEGRRTTDPDRPEPRSRAAAGAEHAYP